MATMEVAYRFKDRTHIGHFRLRGSGGSQTVTVRHHGRTISAKLDGGPEALWVAEVLLGELVQECKADEVKEGQRLQRIKIDETRRAADRQAHFTGL